MFCGKSTHGSVSGWKRDQCPDKYSDGQKRLPVLTDRKEFVPEKRIYVLISGTPGRGGSGRFFSAEGQGGALTSAREKKKRTVFGGRPFNEEFRGKRTR